MEAIKNLKITVLSYENSPPGWVKFYFYDMYNNIHYFEEKVHVINELDVDERSKYPLDATILCKVIDKNDNGTTVDISNEHGTTGADGQVFFVVSDKQFE